MKRQYLALAGLLIVSASGLAGAGTPDCRSQKVEKSVAEMCIVRGEHFQHDTYALKVDGIPIFAIADDFSENVVLEHEIAVGPAIEFPLSIQGQKTVRIVGGCKPVSEGGVEVARVCNFSWGRHQVVRDVRFDFH
jgi:hypothetical protein